MADGQFTRQLATIICVDAVGFSRLIGENGERAVAAFEKRALIIRGTCEAYGGEIFGAAGDSVMAEFGLPTAALMAALEFQKEIAELDLRAPADARMLFRVGINTGDVIVREANRYGDNVNIAARLQEVATPGGIVISQTTLNHVRRVSNAHFCDIGDKHFKHIAYPVRCFLVLSPEAGVPCPDSAPPLVPTHHQPEPEPVLPGGPPAIAILPFRAIGGGAEADATAQGLAEDIVIGLSNMRWLPVIAPSSSFQFRGEAISAAAVGHALGARYLVTGSIETSGRSHRIKAVLEDLSARRTVWARSFRIGSADMPAAPEEIAGEIVAALAKEVDRVEQEHALRIPLERLDSWQLVRRGRLHMSRRTSEDTERALPLFERALELSPDSTSALNELAWWYFWRAWLGFGERRSHEPDLARVVSYARRSLEIDPHDGKPHYHLGIAEIMSGRPRQALAHLDEALVRNPSLSFAHSAKGSAHLLLGEAAKAIPCHLQAERLNPFDLHRFHNLGELSAAYAFVGDWDASADAARTSLDLSPGYWYARMIRIGSLHRAGRDEEAGAELARFALHHPDFDMRRAEFVPYADQSCNRFLIGNFRDARKAGLSRSPV